MSNISGEERTAMRDSFARLLDEQANEEQLRTAMTMPFGYDSGFWKSMAELGLLGLVTDTEHGGIGGDPIVVEEMMEAAGARLLCGPFLSTAIWAASLISSSSDQVLKSERLQAICSGKDIYAVAATSERGLWTSEDVAVRATSGQDGWILGGHASFVLHADAADKLLVLAKNGEAVSVFLVDPESGGVTMESLKANDPTLRISRIDFEACHAILLEGVGETEIASAMDLVRVALSGEQAGGVKQIFEITLEYLRTRHQFGRQIGSYQSLKHMAADMLIEVETATSAARHAAKALASDAQDAQTLINLAAFACADAYRDVSAEAIQLHGGIAYTWEHPAHLYWRRARTGLWLFGSSDHYREQYLTQLEAA